MIKAVIFDMFETLVTLFEGKTYFGEDIARAVEIDATLFRREWHAIEDDRTIGRYTIREGAEIVLKRLCHYTPEMVDKIEQKRRDALQDTFSAIPAESLQLLQALKEKGIRIGLITNAFSDEREMIRKSPLFPYFDVALISYEQGLKKPDLALFQKMTSLLEVDADECLYVGDGGSMELFAARDAGMHPVQCTWFFDRMFEPHIPCGILEEFPHAAHQEEILKFIV